MGKRIDLAGEASDANAGGEAIILRVAFATVDGVKMNQGHFGESPRFDIYRLTAGFAEKVGRVENQGSGAHRDGDHHAHNGSGIGRMLGECGVEVMVSRAFGPNIRRMRQRFLPVKVDADSLEAALTLLQKNWPAVTERWLQGKERRHLVLRCDPGENGPLRDPAEPVG